MNEPINHDLSKLVIIRRFLSFSLSSMLNVFVTSHCLYSTIITTDWFMFLASVTEFTEDLGSPLFILQLQNCMQNGHVL